MPSDTESYVPSTATGGSSPVPTPSKSKMQLEVVIPIRSKHKDRRSRLRTKSHSPIRSDSSVSLGTTWHTSPKHKRVRKKKLDPVGEQANPKGKSKEQRAIVGKSITAVRFESSSPFAPANASQPSSTPRPPSSSIRVNLDNARLDHIQEQENDRGYYDAFPSSRTRSQYTRDSGHSETALLKAGPQLDALDDPGSSTAPGTQEWLKKKETGTGEKTTSPRSHSEDRIASIFSSMRSSQTSSTFSQLTDLLKTPKGDHPTASLRGQGANATSLPNISFTDPDYDLWARVGLRVALEEVVQCYGFPLDIVEKVYESKGSVEETGEFLKQWKGYMEEVLVAEPES